MFVSPDDFTGSDSQKLNQAAACAAERGLPLRIGKRTPTADAPRDHWLLDSAILVFSNTRMILDDCRIKLADSCRDNFIRSANCIPGGDFVPPAENIHITGRGNAILEGADDPRSTGDSGKQNKAGTEDYVSSYGSDGLAPGAPACWGGWRNIGILLVRVHGFTLEGITVKNPHCWGISLEYCTGGTVRNITFDSIGKCSVRGRQETVRNQDGLDLRRGCRNILVENIRGRSGDDVVALTAIGAKVRPAGQERTTEFCGMQAGEGVNDTAFIEIRNVEAYCSGGHHIVRFLNNGGIKLHHIRLENVVDTSPEDFHCKAAVKVGDLNYGGLAAAGDTAHFRISGIRSRAQHGVLLAGPLTDSEITGVTMFENGGDPITRQCTAGEAYRDLIIRE